jgi:DNA-binding CsgD family transcriptional regulator
MRSTPDSVLPSLACARLWQDFGLGRYDEAEADAQTTIRVSDELGIYVHKFEASQLLSIIAALRCDFTRARQMLRAAERADDVDDDVRVPGLLLIRGYITAAEGNPVESARILKPLMDSASISRNYWPRSQEWMRLHAGIALSAGDRQFAAAAVARADLAAERNAGVASYEGLAYQVRGLVTKDSGLLGHAVDVLRRSPRPSLLAMALADHGETLLSTPDRDLGIERLREAAEIFGRIGQRLHYESAQRALQSAGVQPRRSATHPADRPETGWEALTATEHAVAELVSRGQTNRAAATDLGISVHTVGTHLRSIFAKLGVHSRVELANAWNKRRDNPHADAPIGNASPSPSPI